MRQNLARVPNERGPLGLKAGKPEKPRKGLRPVSAKKAAKKRQEAADGAREHMARVAALPCLVCGSWPVEVHHLPDPRSDWRVIPLCVFHHRKEFGEQAYHFSKRKFHALHGSSDDLLKRVADMLGE